LSNVEHESWPDRDLFDLKCQKGTVFGAMGFSPWVLLSLGIILGQLTSLLTILLVIGGSVAGGGAIRDFLNGVIRDTLLDFWGTSSTTPPFTTSLGGLSFWGASDSLPELTGGWKALSVGVLVVCGLICLCVSGITIVSVAGRIHRDPSGIEDLSPSNSPLPIAIRCC
jgi:hypothetical protein